PAKPPSPRKSARNIASPSPNRRLPSPFIFSPRCPLTPRDIDALSPAAKHCSTARNGRPLSVNCAGGHRGDRSVRSATRSGPRRVRLARPEKQARKETALHPRRQLRPSDAR
ncbi:hypothetical protein IscW_ISCW022808, partial [Ixodes scapularis]